MSRAPSYRAHATLADRGDPLATIPGAENADQAAHNAGALRWHFTSEEIAALDTSNSP